MTTRKIRAGRSKIKINYDDQYVVVVSRSNANIQAQLLEPKTNKVLTTATSNKIKSGTKQEKSTKVGEAIAKYMKDNKIDKAVFNRSGYLYHGRIKNVAEAIREAGITI